MVVARELLGKYLVRKTQKGIKKGKIVEVEAYIGPKDKAAHTYGGKITKRNEPVYLIGGHTYIYLCYWMYWMLNLVTQDKGIPECVLIRAVEPITDKKSVSSDLTNGPGKLTKALKIDKSFNGVEVFKLDSPIIITIGKKIDESEIGSSHRIGVKKDLKVKLRFFLKNNRFVSK